MVSCAINGLQKISESFDTNGSEPFRIMCFMDIVFLEVIRIRKLPFTDRVGLRLYAKHQFKHTQLGLTGKDILNYARILQDWI